MMRLRWTCSVIALFAFGCAAAPPPPGPPPTVFVEFSEIGLRPKQARLAPGRTLAWVNQSSYVAVVTLPLSTRRHFRCDRLEPTFTPSRGRLVSVPISARGQLALPCPLEPGEYEYDLDVAGSIEYLFNPMVRLEGRILVR